MIGSEKTYLITSTGFVGCALRWFILKRRREEKGERRGKKRKKDQNKTGK